MTDALIVLAAMLTVLRTFDVWSTYQILKYGGYEKTRVTKWLMDRIGVYPALCLLFVQFVGGAWADPNGNGEENKGVAKGGQVDAHPAPV